MQPSFFPSAALRSSTRRLFAFLIRDSALKARDRSRAATLCIAVVSRPELFNYLNGHPATSKS